MASMTDYQVLHAGSFEIDSKPTGTAPWDHKPLDFTLPSDFTVGTHRARLVLTYVMNVRSDDASFGIWVNPEYPLKQTERVTSYSLKDAFHGDRGLWTVIDGREFRAGEENRIAFAMQPGDKGHVRFRDVVLWYQRGAGG